MPTNPFGSGVSRFIDGADKQFAAVVFQKSKPPCDAELNLISLVDLESRAEIVRSTHPSGWLTNPTNPYSDFNTSPAYSNTFYFGRNSSSEIRNLMWVVVNGWLVPVAGTRTGTPPLSPNDVDTWNKIQLNPPNTSTGGNRAEFIFLEVWLATIDVDPAPPSIAPGKPQRESVYKFGNIEGGFSFLPDGLIDPDLNFETAKRVQTQYRIRVVADANMTQNPEGFDKTMVFAQGLLSSPSAIPFQNMRKELGDPGLWRAGTGDPSTFGTIDGYVYAVPICSVFRRNSAGFSDIGNLAGSFNRNSMATNREDATEYTGDIYLESDLLSTDTSFILSNISGTFLSTMVSFGGAYFKIDDEIIKIDSIVQTGPTSFVININRGSLQTVIRDHKSGTKLVLMTIRPDGLFADQVAITDILDMRHIVSESFDYDTILKTNLMELLKGNLRTTWKRFGSTNSSGPVVLYGDRITDSTVFVGGLSKLDEPNGNRRVFSDAIVTERYEALVNVPLDSASINDYLTVNVPPYINQVQWTGTDPSRVPGSGFRLDTVSGVDWWWNGDELTIKLSDFQAGLPTSDADQVRFVLPDEDEDSVLVRFEGMTTDPNGGFDTSVFPQDTAPTVSHPTIDDAGSPRVMTGRRILKHGDGLNVTTNSHGDLVITLDSYEHVPGEILREFNDAMSGFITPTITQAIGTKMHIQFAVVYGAGRGLSHKPKHIHTVNWLGSPSNSSKVMLRPGLPSMNRMIPTYLSESPLVQTGKNRSLSRTSEVMVDPGSKTVYVAPYRNVLIPSLLTRSGYQLNWYGTIIPVFQGPMPKLNQSGSVVVNPITDPLSLFWSQRSDDMVNYELTRYAEIPFEFLPRPGLHHIPIISITNSIFPSGLNFLLMSKEGPFGGTNTSDWNRNIISYPDRAGYYIVTPRSTETYGNASGSYSIFGQKYNNNKISLSNGTHFRGIQFPPFLAPSRITGVYLRDPATNPVVPNNSPFDVNRKYIGGTGTDINLLRDDCDAATILLDVDKNGDLTFILSLDAIDLNKAPSGTTFENSHFLVECTLFAFDRGFLQTNGRILVCKNPGGGSIPIGVNNFTNASDGSVGMIVPAPMTLGSSNNEVTIYYSRVPYQGDAFGTQGAYSDDLQRVGPLSLGEAQSIFNNPLGSPETLNLKNKSGFEILSSVSFVTSSGTGRLSGSCPIPLLSMVSNPDGVQDYSGTLVDLNRRFSLNRVGYEDWVTPKFPVLSTSVTSRADIKRGALSEVYDRDLHPEFSGCISNLPLGAWFRDKDFLGKILYQTRSVSNAAMIPVGTLSLHSFHASQNQTSEGLSKWEGTEFVCGSASNITGFGSEALIKVDGTHVVTDIYNFKTTRGGAAYSVTSPWSGSAISAKVTKARPNSEAGSVLAGIAYLVKSQPETVNSVEVHAGHELQLVIVTQAFPSYFRTTEVSHSASGVNEGFTAVDRFRILGKPLEKTRRGVDMSVTPSSKPIFINDIWDDPIFYGSSDPNLSSFKQELVTILTDGQTIFADALSNRPLDPSTVQAWLNGVKLAYGVDYEVGGPPFNRDLTYTGVPSLLTTDVLEIFYAML